MSRSRIVLVVLICRRAEQLVLYARGLELLSAALDMAKTEILADRLKPSNTVRNGECSCVCTTLISDAEIQVDIKIIVSRYHEKTCSLTRILLSGGNMCFGLGIS